MGDLKPLGSEKLNGDDKLRRILELTYYNSTPKKSTTTSNKTETIKESVNKTIFGIVKEKDGYYVKKGLNENSLDYIGGMFMKNKNKFSSYAEALKRMDLLVGQERLNEATKYVLKQKAEGGSTDTSAVPPAGGDAPPPPPAGDAPPPPPAEGDVPPPPVEGEAPPPPAEGDDLPPPDEGEAPPPPTEGGESKRSDYMSDVQKFAGKLGQELRDQREKMESDDIKYVLNMVISAVDLELLEDDDIEEIGKKFDREENSEGEEEMAPEPPSEGEEEMAPEPPSEGEEEMAPEPPSEGDLGETAMDKLESFINTPITDEYEMSEVDLEKYNDLGEEENVEELDLDEIKDQISKSIGETLSKYFK